MRKSKKLFLFVLFALVSTLFNLLTQRVILSFQTTNLYFIIAFSSDICASDDNIKSVMKVKAIVRNKKKKTYLVNEIFFSNKLESINASR